LRDDSLAAALSPALQRLVSVLTEPLQRYLKAPDAASRKFAATWLMLRFPGTRPYVTTGFGRLTPLEGLDHLRDNWWCALPPGMPNGAPGYGQPFNLSEPLQALYGNRGPQASFLSPQQRDQAKRELVDLGQVPLAPNYLAASVLEWVRLHPEDPRAPEALHLTVSATRYACGDAHTSEYSKQAFQFLHEHYPDSEWARKTKYWY